MACPCRHTPAAPAEAARTRPMDQCIACAQKHFDEAYCLFHEYTYGNANRRWIRGSLRAVVGHTYSRWPLLASQARELALLIQENRDGETSGLWERLGEDIDRIYLDENPEARKNLEALKYNIATGK